MWSVPSRLSDPSTATRIFDRLLSRTRAAAGVRDDAELRSQHDAVAVTLDGTADECLVGIRTVDFGGIKMCHAEIQRPVNRANRLGVVHRADVVVGRHRHGAESNA